MKGIRPFSTGIGGMNGMAGIAGIVATALVALCFGLFASAGSIVDTDADLVPDVFDNCRNVANGPAGGGCGPFDGDDDGFGNLCDGDFTNDGLVGGTDFAIFVEMFGSPQPFVDITCDGVVGGTDFGFWLPLFGSVPGPGATAI